MRILILNWRDIKNPSGGGAEILTHEIAKRLVTFGHSVVQFSSSFPGALSEETIDGIEIIRKGHPDARYLFRSVHFLAFWHYQRFFKGEFDIVIDEIHGIPFFTPWYIREKKVVLICEVAGELWKKIFGPFFGLLGEITERFYLRNVYRTTPCLTISDSTKRDLIEHGVEEEHITVLPMGISIPKKLKIFKKESKPTLLFIGRLTIPKGIEDAIEAFKEIERELPGAQLWVIGRGNNQYVAGLKRLSKKLNLYNRIQFFGFISEEKKFELMSKAHVLLHPSLREGFGLTIPEAGIVGTPVIGYNSSGIRDIIRNGKNGVLLTQNSSKELAYEAILLLRDKKQYEKLAHGAQIEAQKYNWDKTAKTALSIMESL